MFHCVCLENNRKNKHLQKRKGISNEQIIVKNIKSILKYTLGSFELLIILDFCSDNSEKELLQFFSTFKNDNNNFHGVRIFKQENSPIFEASCDNIGFINATGEFCLEVQADMQMTEKGYNLQLTKPFLLLDNVFAVSGRCAHNLFCDNKGVGKVGQDIEKTIEEIGVNRNTFYVYDSCNRGPILFSKQKLEELCFLNEKLFFLDNSDHDVIARAFLEKNYISGYVPINFSSPLQDGSTRNKKINKTNGKYKSLRKKQCLIENNLAKLPSLKSLFWLLPTCFVRLMLRNSSLKKPSGWEQKEITSFDIT